MNQEQLKALMNFLPENMRERAIQSTNKALEMIDPSQIRTMEDARRAINALKSKGLNNEVIAKANSYLESPVANMICSMLGVNKKDLKNGLQTLSQLDTPSASTNNFPLLEGIDQLK